MADDNSDNNQQTTPVDANALAQQRTDLALQRTIIASERTLMAWIRTSISMIGFGFTIYKFLEYLRQSEAFQGTIRLRAPRNLALALIVLGTLALPGAILQHRQFMKRIGASQTQYIWSLAVLVAILVALIGVLVFLGILLKVGPF